MGQVAVDENCSMTRYVRIGLVALVSRVTVVTVIRG
jgi:hypothetical protein